MIENIVDPITEGRHSLLREAAIELNRQQIYERPTLSGDPRQGTVATQVLASLHLYPTTLFSVSSLLRIRSHKIDMGSLLRAPHELFMNDEEWAGKGIRERRRRKLVRVKQADDGAVVSLMCKTTEVEEPERSLASLDSDLRKGDVNGGSDFELEPIEELNEVLDCIADLIVELDQKIRANVLEEGRSVNGSSNTNGEVDKDERSDHTPEDPALRSLRLNLLALAKRAPLDTIARLPKDLVPAHIRHIIPTSD